MRYCTLLMTLLTILSLAGTGARAEQDAHAADRQALRSMLTEIETALNARSLEPVLGYLDPQVVITYQNAEVSRGHAEAMAYFKRMMEGAGSIVKTFQTRAEVAAPAVFHGDTAVAYGSTNDHYELRGGLDFTLNGLWSTTLQKQDGTWKVLAIHFSSNLFDNPLLNLAKRMNWAWAVGGFVAGLLLMLIVGRRRKA